MKTKRLPKWKREMIREIRRMNRFIQKLKRFEEHQVICHNFAFRKA